MQSTRTGSGPRSGVPVLTRHRPGAEVTTVTVWVLAGARQEGDRAGATHLLEHVLTRSDLPGLGQRPLPASTWWWPSQAAGRRSDRAAQATLHTAVRSSQERGGRAGGELAG